MNSYLIIISIILLFFCCVFFAYHDGTKKTLSRVAAFFLPLLLAGTAVRLGNILIPNSKSISFYIAGLGTLLFYAILYPIFMRKKSDRYSRISKNSRMFAMILGVLEAWLILGFTFFFISLFVTISNPILAVFINWLTFPIKFIWFFPKIML